jgi:hypothetical protein
VSVHYHYPEQHVTEVTIECDECGALIGHGGSRESAVKSADPSAKISSGVGADMCAKCIAYHKAP